MGNASTISSPTGDAKLSYFVEWRRLLWTPAIQYLIDDPKRFAGKRVLEIGCRHGRMSCLFGLLGATVLGIELAGVSLERARAEAERWNVQRCVSFGSYGGTPDRIPDGPFDYIFTKSVLVTVPNLEQFLHGLADRLNENGELLAAENLAGGPLLGVGRNLLTYRRYQGLERRFNGVDPKFLMTVRNAFPTTEVKTFYRSVVAIRARRT